VTYLQHARRHLPGGTDPLPVTGGVFWPLTYQVPLFECDRGSSFVGGFNCVKLDSGIPYGATFNNFDNLGSTQTPQLGDAFYFACLIGPTYSNWGFSCWFRMGNDYGQPWVAFSPATDAVTALNGDLPYYEGSPDNLTYTDIATLGDQYHATASIGVNNGGSGFTVGAANSPAEGLNYFKVYVKGKNASAVSPFYKCAFASLTLSRHTGGGPST